jgi:hypothetical protein
MQITGAIGSIFTAIQQAAMKSTSQYGHHCQLSQFLAVSASIREMPNTRASIAAALFIDSEVSWVARYRAIEIAHWK